MTRLFSPTVGRFFRFIFRRVLLLAGTVIVAVYLSILVANYGGYIDEIIRGRIANQMMGQVQGGWLSEESPEEREAIINETVAAMEEAAGLNRPFPLRSLSALWDGLLLRWEEPVNPRAYQSESRTVRGIILERLTRTLTVFGSAMLILFCITLVFALRLARRFGTWVDNLFVLLSSVASAPAWIYGVILTAILLRLDIFSISSSLAAWPDDFRFATLPFYFRLFALPFLAMLLSGLFQSAYAWRAYFLVYSNEPYVDLARAKGIDQSRIERRYILRPALPALLTSFSLLLMSLWQEAIALEVFFDFAGIGQLLLSALQRLDTPIVIGLVVVFAYLLAMTVLILDVAYALVDPRIRVGSDESETATAAGSTRRAWRDRLRRPAAWGWRFDRRRFNDRLRRWGRQTGAVLRQLLASPSAVVGLLIILLLTGTALYTVVALPYQEAIALWRGEENIYARNPRNARPLWTNRLRVNKLPPNIALSSHDPQVGRQVVQASAEVTELTLTYPIRFEYNVFPQDIVLDIESQFEERGPHIIVSWIDAAGQVAEMTTLAPRQTQSYFVAQDERLMRRLNTEFPHKMLFANPESGVIVPGQYGLEIKALLFEPESTIEADLTVIGQVHGLAGTDATRRDLMVAVQWGTVIALLFGLIAVVTTSLTSMLLGAAAAWYGGRVDQVIQFLTETNLILPFYPIALMVFTLYSKTIWAILAVTILLNIFNQSVKLYRATFLQVKQASYVTGAIAYGASDWRIVTRYLIPRIGPLLIPRLILLVPSFVYLEATLAFLGLSDPTLPTWGKLVVAALFEGVYGSSAHIVWIPLGLLLMTGFAFAMVGLALERILDPKMH